MEKKTAYLETRGFSTFPSCVGDTCGSVLRQLARPVSCVDISDNYWEWEDFSLP